MTVFLCFLMANISQAHPCLSGMLVVRVSLVLVDDLCPNDLFKSYSY
jgi:hypothetical protein